MDMLKQQAKAVGAGIGAAVAYLIGALDAVGPDAGLGDLSLARILGTVPVVLAVYGITWAVPNRQNGDVEPILPGDK